MKKLKLVAPSPKLSKNRSNKNFLFDGFFFAAVLTLFAGVLFFHSNTNIIGFVSHENEELLVLTQDDLISLVKPAVVRVVNNFEGELVIPSFDFDTETLRIVFDNKKPVTIPINEYATGSGFFISSDGHILTNAHVVNISSDDIKRPVVQITVSQVMLTKLLQLQALNPEKAEELDKKFTYQEQVELGKKAAEDVYAKTLFNINNKIVILNPLSSKENISELFKDGFQAKTEAINNNHVNDQKDIAILMIEGKDLPSIHLGTSNKLSLGQKIYTFGFPSNAQFSSRDYLEPTLTQGIISAIKDSEDKSFKIFQTDAKISEGSSGSPVFDETGKVVGIITFQTGNIHQLSGDNFAFAIPIEVANDVMARNSIENKADHTLHFINGIALMRASRCKKAIEEYELAKNSNQNFNVGSYINLYIQKCNELIDSGKSIDSRWDEIKEKIKNHRLAAWLIGGFLIISPILLFIVVKLTKRLKKDEQQLKQFSTSSFQNNTIDPRLYNYIENTRSQGLGEEIIKSNLISAGWSDTDIEIALKNKKI